MKVYVLEDLDDIVGVYLTLELAMHAAGWPVQAAKPDEWETSEHQPRGYNIWTHESNEAGIKELDLDLVKCPCCDAISSGTMSCDQCGKTHCDLCMGTDHMDRTLCLKCATVIDTEWGKFVRVL